MNEQEFNLFRATSDLRTQMLNILTDEDLAFALPNNPPLGDLCRQMARIEAIYINSFKTFKQDWSIGAPDGADSNSVATLKGVFKTLDDEFEAILKAIPDGDFQAKTIDRGGGFILPLGGQFHVYREALLIFYGKCSVYLLALGKPFSQQWRDLIG